MPAVASNRTTPPPWEDRSAHRWLPGMGHSHSCDEQPATFRAIELGSEPRDTYIVEQLWWHHFGEQGGIERVKTLPGPVSNIAQRWPNAPGQTAASNVRTGQPSHDAVNSSVTVVTSIAPARSAVLANAFGSNVCRSTTDSSADARDDSSNSVSRRSHVSLNRGNWVMRVATHQVVRDSRRAI